MAQRGGQPGNKNGAKGAAWKEAVKRALARYDEKSKNPDEGRANWRRGLERVAHKYIEAASEGEQWAIRDLADRIDGKPNQTVEVTTYDGITDEDIDARIDQIFADRTEARSVEVTGTEGTEPEGTVH